MKERIILFTVVIFIMCFYGVSPVGAKMVKEVAIGVMDDAPSQAELDRYYMQYHGPEVMRTSGPWMTRYQLWLPYVPPKEAVERFGAVRGRYAELWYHEDELSDLPKGISAMTMPPWPISKRSGQTVVDVPANPTETFYDSDPSPAKTTILRWVTIIAYPEGVSVEDGEKWFLNVYAKEALKQPGLLKFVSHRVLSKNSGESGDKTPPPQTSNDKPAQSGDKTPQMSEMPRMKSWVRVCEYWYKDLDAWRKAVLESPPKYTTPSWGGKYPFVEMKSTFIPYYNDVDFLKGTYRLDSNQQSVIYNTTP